MTAGVEPSAAENNEGAAIANRNISGAEALAPSRWFSICCVTLICVVWPLIWVGSLVTTYDAGMSVPDWPGTYGHNLLLYPIDTWVFGPFDLFIEHGHRLLGIVAGIVAIAIVVSSFVTKRPRSIITLSILTLLMVCLQGLLGGMRVRLGDQTLALLHGCSGQMVFCMCVLLAVVSGRWWYRVASPGEPSGDVNGEADAADGEAVQASAKLQQTGSTLPIATTLRVHRFDLFVVLAMWGLATTQLVLGANIRHVSGLTSPPTFVLLIAVHVVVAFVLWAVVGLS
ncbi:MAG: COX15/CtaA family protein, partial [Planctomycetota bacterium]